jgi:hypothetical protein
MYRGTTPHVRVRVKGVEDMAQLTKIYVTFAQKGVQIDKTGSDLTIDGDCIEMTLTQAETLSLKADKRVRVQLRATTKDGSAVASGISEVYVSEILKDGVIADA